jgi:hypothetical protein
MRSSVGVSQTPLPFTADCGRKPRISGLEAVILMGHIEGQTVLPSEFCAVIWDFQVPTIGRGESPR